jgi:hypothetical protein
MTVDVDARRCGVRCFCERACVMRLISCAVRPGPHCVVVVTGLSDCPQRPGSGSDRADVSEPRCIGSMCADDGHFHLRHGDPHTQSVFVLTESL